jgi:DNA-binding response OmpR family regulator
MVRLVIMKTVYVVDDERSILEALEFMLLEEGYSVKTFSRGTALLDIHGELPDVILLDVLLSGEDGREIARRLKSQEKTRHIPIIMISAHPNAAVTVRECGADAFLPKPFDVNDLLQIVARHSNQVN